MKITLGEMGLENSFQEPFTKTIKCHKCKGIAKIMFVADELEVEDGYEEYICNFHKTTGKEGGLWLHDACAIACYLCPKCFEVTSELNQA